MEINNNIIFLAFVLIANLFIASTICDNEANFDNPVVRELKETIELQIDKDHDGLVSYEELRNYLAELHNKNIDFYVNKKWITYSPQIHEVFSWEGYEPETKQVLTWEQYFNKTYPSIVGKKIPGLTIHRQQDTSNQPPDESKTSDQREAKIEDGDPNEHEFIKLVRSMVRKADIKWKLADENGDSLLTKEEFKYFVFPEEGGEELQKVYLKEATEAMDTDNDGHLSLVEFIKQLQNIASEEDRTNQTWLASQQESFGSHLDRNKDGILEEPEIKHWLLPHKEKRFDDEATRLLRIGDRNVDYRLSENEILDNSDKYRTLLPAEFLESLEDSKTAKSKSVGHDEL